jgi:DNA-binding transcriptional LysR family regulator
MIDLRRLRALRAVADHGTLAAAADALHLTPSAVSQQLAALEREAGRPLLEPAGRSVRLTGAAQVLLEHATLLFAQLERLEGDLAALADEPRGEIRVAAFPTAVAGLIAPAVAILRERAPGVTLRIHELEPPQAVTALTRGAADAMVGMECSSAPQHGDPRYHRVDLLADTLDAALPIAHPLAGAERIALSELAGETWISPPEGWSCYEVFVAGCHAAGFAPNVAHEAGDWQSTISLIAAGLGVALVPRLAQRTRPDVVLVPLAGVAPRRHVLAACRAGAERIPALAALLGALAEQAGAQAPLAPAA